MIQNRALTQGALTSLVINFLKEAPTSSFGPILSDFVKV